MFHKLFLKMFLNPFPLLQRLKGKAITQLTHRVQKESLNLRIQDKIEFKTKSHNQPIQSHCLERIEIEIPYMTFKGYNNAKGCLPQASLISFPWMNFNP